MENRNKTTWLIWLAGATLTILLFGGRVLVNGVIANERLRVEKDIEIRTIISLQGERVSRLEECIVSVKSDLGLMRSDIREILRYITKRE